MGREVKRINALEAYQKIRNSGGRLFIARFTKKDGGTRRMFCRRGVQAGTNGKGLAYKPEAKLLVNVYDIFAEDYRMVNLCTLASLRMGRNEYRVVGFQRV